MDRPVAVWNWNTALAWVCGDVCVWKPSEKSPLCAIALNGWAKLQLGAVFVENLAQTGEALDTHSFATVPPVIYFSLNIHQDLFDLPNLFHIFFEAFHY